MPQYECVYVQVRFRGDTHSRAHSTAPRVRACVRMCALRLGGFYLVLVSGHRGVRGVSRGVVAVVVVVAAAVAISIGSPNAKHVGISVRLPSHF